VHLSIDKRRLEPYSLFSFHFYRAFVRRYHTYHTSLLPLSLSLPTLP
jgi:hypothetical protein